MSVLYIIYLVSIISLGSFNVGPLSMRVYMTLIMLCVLLMHINKTITRLPNKHMLLFVVFILLMGLSLSMNGELGQFQYLKTILSFHVVSIIAYYSLGSYMDTDRKLIRMTNVLLAVLLLTSIATILQYFNNPVGWGMRLFFTSHGLSEGLQESIATSEGVSMLGKSLTVGIFEHAFTNSMFISSSGVVAIGMFFFANNKRIKIVYRFWYLLVAVLAIVACFMTQQRAAFFFMLAAYVVIILMKNRNRAMTLLLSLLLVIVGYFMIDFNAIGQSEELGRMAISVDDIQEDSRSDLWASASSFISSHLMWGGPISYLQISYGLASHNFFYNAFIYGGLLGAIVVIILFFMMCLRSLSCIVRKIGRNTLSPYFAIGLLIFLAGGFFHNASLVLGSTQIFILFAFMIASESIENRIKS